MIKGIINIGYRLFCLGKIANKKAGIVISINFTLMNKITGILLLLSFIFIGAAYQQNDEEPRIKTKAALGRKLFNEKILSKDSSVSCASCHKPEFAFADTAAFSIGIYGKLTKRNTPSVLNMKQRPYFFWDGRATSLEMQALMPIQDPSEMGLPIEEAIERLKNSKEYQILFLRIFKEAPNAKNLSLAFSAFEKTLETVNSKFDDWGNHLGKLSVEEENGRQLFIDKAHCFDCHFRDDFTDDEFRNIGLYNGADLSDKGRFLISSNNSDLGKFKTAGLRNVGVTAPYMHNGMFKTLEEVINYYDNPALFVKNPQNIDPDLKFPLHLSKKEKQELIAFLRTLTDKAYLRTESGH